MRQQIKEKKNKAKAPNKDQLKQEQVYTQEDLDNLTQ